MIMDLDNKTPLCLDIPPPLSLSLSLSLSSYTNRSPAPARLYDSPRLGRGRKSV